MVAETAHGLNYAIDIDKAKNRLRIRFFGDILDAAANARIPADTKDAASRLTPGFACLADFTEVGMLGLPDIAKQVQVTLLESGVRKVASVWSKEGFSKLVVQRSAEQAGDAYANKRQVFSNLAEAEAWLDA